ncbi:glycosyltransferase family 4 protein [Opitutales bacterium ASA1]|uniref:glycosyltransferase n=1 Tax=Congregicoccus parvus TaxID=3081749 RepID=UPI002B30EB38|nr:glycosyltransferase family 4 protein [Opitutales bacterium ASA1]
MGAVTTQSPAGPRVLYLFTRFPHLSETFLQREFRAMLSLGVSVQAYSLHRGGGTFEGVEVRRFVKWRLLHLFWAAPLACLRTPEVLVETARRLFTTWPRDWMNMWENLYGAGVGVLLARELRVREVDHVHAVWASLPATAAWMVSLLGGVRFSVGAHAYDLFEYGGDWLLAEKCARAVFVHTSTEAGLRRLVEVGVPAERIALVRRGLDRLPAERVAVRAEGPIRVVCVARLVEKKGLLRQIGIYRDLVRRGVDLRVRLVGDGPLRGRLAVAIRHAGLEGVVEMAGALENEAVWRELAAADVLVHTGVVSRTGDRDGLPNVVPEAMAAGAIVITAPAAGVEEAVAHRRTGLVCPLEDLDAWEAAFRLVAAAPGAAAELRSAARAWVEQHFDARRNAALLLARFGRGDPESDLASGRGAVSRDDAVV